MACGRWTGNHYVSFSGVITTVLYYTVQECSHPVEMSTVWPANYREPIYYMYAWYYHLGWHLLISGKGILSSLIVWTWQSIFFSEAILTICILLTAQVVQLRLLSASFSEATDRIQESVSAWALAKLRRGQLENSKQQEQQKVGVCRIWYYVIDKGWKSSKGQILLLYVLCLLKDTVPLLNCNQFTWWLCVSSVWYWFYSWLGRGISPFVALWDWMCSVIYQKTYHMASIPVTICQLCSSI